MCLALASAYLWISAEDVDVVAPWSDDAPAARELCRMEGHRARIHAIAVSPDGKWAGSCDDGGIARTWDLDSGTEHAKFRSHSGILRAIVFSRDGAAVITAGDDSVIRMWSARTGELIREFKGHSAGVYSLAVSHDGNYLISGADVAMGNRQAGISVWDVRTGGILFQPAFPGVAGWSVVLPGDACAVTQHADGLTYWNLKTGAVTRHVPPFEPNTKGIRMQFSPAEPYWMVSPNGSRLTLWDIRRTRDIRRWKACESTVNCVACSPSHTWALAGSGEFDTIRKSSRDCVARLWNLTNAKQLCRMVGHTGRVSGVAFTPDGSRALTCSDDCTIRVWQLPDELFAD